MTSRRTFLGSAAALLAVVATHDGMRAFASAAESATEGASTPLRTWLQIGEDGMVTFFTGKVEIGMGVITGLTQIVADELDVPLSHVRAVTGDTALTPDQGGVGGSTSTELGAFPLRNAAAEARRVLLEAAAARLRVPADRLVVTDGVVRDRTNPSASVPYGALVAALANAPPLHASGENFAQNVTGAAKPKAPADYRYVGKPVARIDVAPKAYGTFRYVVDVRVPGMLHGRVVRPPAAGARLLGVDEAPLRAFGDARLVRIGDFLGVVASREWDAVRGARALEPRWSAGPRSFPAQSALPDAMWAAPVSSQDKVVARGDLAAGFAGADVVEARYAWPFQAHAMMGPGCAVADVAHDGTARVWTGGQKPFALREGIADLLGVPLEKVRVTFVEDAGSYGRGGFDDTAADAVLLSRAVGKPVRVQAMRSDTTQWGPKAPAIVAHLRGAVRDGAIAALDLTVRSFNGGEISSHPDSAGNFIGGQLAGHPNDKPRVEYAAYGRNSATYRIPALHAVAELIPPLVANGSPLRTTHLRDPEGPGTTFVIESFVDELAAKAGADPLAFRIAHLDDARQAGVLRAVATASQWRSGRSAAKRQTGLARGRGVAFATRGKTVVATVAEVAVDTASGAVRVTRLVCAHDCGFIVNPRSLRGTIEANLMQSMSRALYEEVKFDESTVTSRDWASYPVVRTPDVPDSVEVVLIEHGADVPSYGAGEPSSRPTAAAIANAIYDATGARVRRAPLTPENVLAALHGA
ncbi:MAG TPA: molybdopterin cofactor-binding domain-containing protein [Candidatus Elarobacter sp.]|nr:molybdopterin cofactor-binding domain-containing protein [Candidatus Elarobacter sp.]